MNVKDDKLKAFTLIEVLISIALISVISTAYLSLMVSLDKRSTRLEIEDTAQSIAIEKVNEIRKMRLDVDGWANIVGLGTSTTERIYRYDPTTGFNKIDPKAITSYPVSNYSEFKTFCINNPDYCAYSNSTVFRNTLAYSDIFSVLISVKKIVGSEARVITVYVGCKPERNCETYVKMSTVVYHY